MERCGLRKKREKNTVNREQTWIICQSPLVQQNTDSYNYKGSCVQRFLKEPSRYWLISYSTVLTLFV